MAKQQNIIQVRTNFYVVQEFAWTEDALPARKAERGSSIGAEAAAKLSEEPMFCFEVRSLHM